MTIKELREKFKELYEIEPSSRLSKDELMVKIENADSFKLQDEAYKKALKL